MEDSPLRNSVIFCVWHVSLACAFFRAYESSSFQLSHASFVLNDAAPSHGVFLLVPCGDALFCDDASFSHSLRLIKNLLYKNMINI